MREVWEQRDVDLLAHQAVAHPGYILGESVAVAGHHEVYVWLYHAMVEAVANTNPGRFLIQGSPSNTGRDWFTLQPFAAMTGTPATQALSATETPGSTVINVSGAGSPTGFVARDELYIQNPAVELGEWHTIKCVQTDTSITLVEGIDNTQGTSSTLWGTADKFVAAIPLRGVRRMRAVFDHAGASAASAHILAKAIFVPALVG